MESLTFQSASHYLEDPYLCTLIQNEKKCYSIDAHEKSAMKAGQSFLGWLIEKICHLVSTLFHKIRGYFSKSYRQNFVGRVERVLEGKRQAEEKEKEEKEQLAKKLEAEKAAYERDEREFKAHVKELETLKNKVSGWVIEAAKDNLRIRGVELDARKTALKVSLKKQDDFATMLEDISTQVHEKVSQIWETFFSHFGKEVRWQCEGGEFHLKLRKKLKLWVPEETLKKGNVLVLDEFVQGRLEKGTMHFEKGFWSYCEYGGVNVSPAMTRIIYDREKEVLGFEGKLWLKKDIQEKPFSEVVKNWREKGKVVEDHEEAIKSAGSKR